MAIGHRTRPQRTRVPSELLSDDERMGRMLYAYYYVLAAHPPFADAAGRLIFEAGPLMYQELDPPSEILGLTPTARQAVLRFVEAWRLPRRASDDLLSSLAFYGSTEHAPRNWWRVASRLLFSPGLTGINRKSLERPMEQRPEATIEVMPTVDDRFAYRPFEMTPAEARDRVDAILGSARAFAFSQLEQAEESFGSAGYAPLHPNRLNAEGLDLGARRLFRWLALPSKPAMTLAAIAKEDHVEIPTVRESVRTWAAALGIPGRV